jgi:hypothetical protein
MAKGDYLGEFEQLLLTALMLPTDEALVLYENAQLAEAHRDRRGPAVQRARPKLVGTPALSVLAL